MRILPLSIALMAATIAPAWAEPALVVTGEGRPRVPSQYLGVETARTLPDGDTVVSLGAGTYVGSTLSLSLDRGFGAQELGLNVAYSPALGMPFGAVGYKRGIGWLGPWSSAVVVQAGVAASRAPEGTVLAAVPLDAQFGPAVLTVQPRALVRGLFGSQTSVVPALMAGLAWPLGGGLTAFGEAAAGYVGGFVPAGALGLRWTPMPSLAVDLQGGTDPTIVGLNLLQPQNGQLSATVRFGF